MPPRRSRKAPVSGLGTAKLDIANRLFFRLYQASNLMHKVGTRYVSALDSTTQQWAVLGALAGPPASSEGLNVKELMERLLVSRQNLTAVLDRLETKRWVERVRDEADGRSRRIHLTREGQHVWAKMLPAIAQFYEGALAGFTLEDRVSLFRLLDRLKEGLNGL